MLESEATSSMKNTTLQSEAVPMLLKNESILTTFAVGLSRIDDL